MKPLRAGLIALLSACAAAACSSGAGSSPGAIPPGGTAPGNTAPAGTAPVPSTPLTITPGGPNVPANRTLPASPGGGGTHPAAAWPMYNRTPDRAGVAAGVPAPSAPHVTWRARLDGAVYGQPLLIGSLVVVATENDSVYALDSASGNVAWHARLGTPAPLSSLPCGNVDPLGITGTPVYDQSAGIVYAVAETSDFRHTLIGLSVTDGAVKVSRYLPMPDGPANEKNFQQRPALAIASGRVYAAFGGLYGDCGQYHGAVVGVPLSGGGPLVQFVVPTGREGAIWGTAGPVAGPDGSLYVSSGNGDQTNGGQSYDGSDSVSRLTPGLRRASFFAPATWADDNARDLDLGSTQPALVGGDSLLITGKRGTGYLLSAARLGGIGGAIAQAPVCQAYGAPAVSGNVVYVPCQFDGGITAVAVDAAGRRLTVQWRGPGNANGSPVVGGGVVWVTDWDGGTLYALDPATGQPLHQVALGAKLPHFSSLSLAGAHAYIGTLTGVVAVTGA
jgi:polyvinyl alcohol dehydrogenase (cytochrome)